MYEIEMHQVSDEFVSCWRTAMAHLESKGREAIKWLKSDLIPPFLDHISFRIGNQLFFVRIEDKDNKLDTPSNPDGLKMIADGCNGIACHMPIIRKGVGWEVYISDWGLINPETKALINLPFHTDARLHLMNHHVYIHMDSVSRVNVTPVSKYPIQSEVEIHHDY